MTTRAAHWDRAKRVAREVDGEARAVGRYEPDPQGVQGMIELFQESIRAVNIPYTLFFGFALLYWIVYLTGIIGADWADLGSGADGAGEGLGDGIGESGGVLNGVMNFVYAADVPMTIILSVLSFIMWATAVLFNYYTGNTSVPLSLALSLPFFAGGVVATRFVLRPFVPILKSAFDESSDEVEVIGQVCVITSLEASEKHGQAELPQEGAPLLLTVHTRDGVVLHKGDEAVVVGAGQNGSYIVAPFERGRIED